MQSPHLAFWTPVVGMYSNEDSDSNGPDLIRTLTSKDNGALGNPVAPYLVEFCAVKYATFEKL